MKKFIESIKDNSVDLIILIIVVTLYMINNKYIKIATIGIVHKFFVSYFNDLMAPMFMLSYSNILLKIVDRRIKKLLHVILFCLAIGSVWEFVAPFIKKGAIADPFDILCYLIGGLFYWRLQNRKVILRYDKS